MRLVRVHSVTVANNGVAYVSPRNPSATFEYIYRDASSVRWDAEQHALYVTYEPTPDLATQLQWIVGAVKREYGARLCVDTKTQVDGPQLREILQNLEK